MAMTRWITINCTSCLREITISPDDNDGRCTDCIREGTLTYSDHMHYNRVALLSKELRKHREDWNQEVIVSLLHNIGIKGVEFK